MGIYAVDYDDSMGEGLVYQESEVPKPPPAFTAEQLEAHAEMMRERWPVICHQSYESLAPCHSQVCLGGIRMQYRRGLDPQGRTVWQCARCGAINED